MKTIFTPLPLKNITLKNRIVMPPMCMYSATDGYSTKWHEHHYATRALGGVGLIIVEATGVTPEGRISEHCLGLWDDKFIKGMSDIVNAIHVHKGLVGIQLNHAGRKSETKDPIHYAPSAINFNSQYQMPKEMDESDIAVILRAFKDAAQRALEAGFDFIEIHAAHGYLISQFLSPLTNKRTDKYGTDRSLFLKEVIKEVRSVWPSERPLGIRVSATDWHEDGNDVSDIIALLQPVKEFDVDIINVSTGGVAETNIKAFPGYQIPMSDALKHALDIPTMAGGLISSFDLASSVIENKQADLIFLGRELLRNPFWVHEQVRDTDLKESLIPKQYWRG